MRNLAVSTSSTLIHCSYRCYGMPGVSFLRRKTRTKEEPITGNTSSGKLIVQLHKIVPTRLLRTLLATEIDSDENITRLASIYTVNNAQPENRTPSAPCARIPFYR